MSSADQVLRILWRRKWLVLATFLLVLAAVAAITAALPKVYSTEAFVLVDANRPGASDFEATQTNTVLTKTYAELLQTRNVADEVATQLPFSTTGRALQHQVDIAPVSDTQLIRIQAESGSPAKAQSIANTYARVFVQQTRGLGGT